MQNQSMQDTIWIFGYGSLIWDPGFDPAERLLARAPGWERSFCMRSLVHRGRPEAPGLVLALDEGEGTCAGLAFSVRAGQEAEVMDYLRKRELVTAAYLEREVALDLADGRRVHAVTYVIDRHHDQYCGGLTHEEQAAIIAQAHGGRGPNHEYLFNTAAHLHELGIPDPSLDALAARVRELMR
ncbi:gamma-glutamylcyclotransferase [Thioclava atlantica]|uniref:glutathione-specific gamma-glutamylcyclotransferase n=1 Tax=Thioclava atlantica TaxID=1317124 RepID=A0A085U0A4_9RHOB|nr:gamma-glutamylcyclotransferase [Thioclava atlantica]KFE36401.1 cation transport protein ChaC [Thioclava atlantica]